ncbi:MAG: hypothetical protein GF344_06970, partial [Chitinivibrionales bacterium]|nr:hypothetical protein [Chitinivibrionales bacterium]MBD3356659.1 hypothetical protein [Chitinivibrionales bacterium]
MRTHRWWCKSTVVSFLVVIVVGWMSGLSAQDGPEAFDIAEMNHHAYRDMRVDTARGGLADAGGEREHEPAGITTILFRTIGYLVLIVALIVGMLWGLRKIGMTGT